MENDLEIITTLMLAAYIGDVKACCSRMIKKAKHPQLKSILNTLLQVQHENTRKLVVFQAMPELLETIVF